MLLRRRDVFGINKNLHPASSDGYIYISIFRNIPITMNMWLMQMGGYLQAENATGNSPLKSGIITLCKKIDLVLPLNQIIEYRY